MWWLSSLIMGSILSAVGAFLNAGMTSGLGVGFGSLRTECA
ncbi:putative membrane protein [Mycobacterium kansasii 732]|nr:putative membrane protein [Mycobacterium kansasii 732]